MDEESQEISNGGGNNGSQETQVPAAVVPQATLKNVVTAAEATTEKFEFLKMLGLTLYTSLYWILAITSLFFMAFVLLPCQTPSFSCATMHVFLLFCPSYLLFQVWLHSSFWYMNGLTSWNSSTISWQLGCY